MGNSLMKSSAGGKHTYKKLLAVEFGLSFPGSRDTGSRGNLTTSLPCLLWGIGLVLTQIGMCIPRGESLHCPATAFRSSCIGKPGLFLRVSIFVLFLFHLRKLPVYFQDLYNDIVVNCD